MTWFKDKDLLPAATRYTTNYDLNTCIVSLRIDDAHLTDIGVYRVVGENVAGKDETSCSTFVLNTTNVDQRPLINPEAFRMLDRTPDFYAPAEPVDNPDRAKPPKFIVHLPDQIKLFDGEKVHLKCKVEGYPFPQVG
jgi:hypothetical protein